MRLRYLLATGALAVLGAAPAYASACSGAAIGVDGCVQAHSGYTTSEPKPTAGWTGLFTGTIDAEVIGNFGATSIIQCTVAAGSGSCTRPRWDYMQPGESWTLKCSVVGVGGWSCDHSGGA